MSQRVSELGAPWAVKLADPRKLRRGRGVGFTAALGLTVDRAFALQQRGTQ